MPPSRIAFALVDVAEQARALRRGSADLRLEVSLDSATFEAVFREIADYYPVARSYLEGRTLSALDKFEANGIVYHRLAAPAKAVPGVVRTGGEVNLYPEGGYSYGSTD